MKVFAISDLHLSGNNPKPMDIFGGAWANYLAEIEEDWHAKVTDEDVVLIAGDISWAMHLPDAVPDLRYIGKLPGKKVIIRGNHDYWWKSIGAVRASLVSDTYALQNDSMRFGNILVCGSRGWATPENGKFTPEDEVIYRREIVRFTLALESAEKCRREGDTLIAMVHYPPFNSRFDPSPFTELFQAHGVQAVVYGHLHGNSARACFVREAGGIRYYLTSCDLLRNRLTELQI